METMGIFPGGPEELLLRNPRETIGILLGNPGETLGSPRETIGILLVNSRGPWERSLGIQEKRW